MPNSPTYLVYIVEDDEEDRFLLEEALSAHRIMCRLFFFANGSEMFVRLTHQLDERLPDVIVLDLDTPIMNGFDTLRLLKEMDEYRRVPVIVRTAHDEDAYIDRCFELGCQAYVTKNKQPLHLANVVRALCKAA